MAEKRHKFTSREQAAKRTSRRGWRNLTTEELDKVMEQPANWTRREAANLARIATALEGIRAELKQMRQAGERSGVNAEQP